MHQPRSDDADMVGASSGRESAVLQALQRMEETSERRHAELQAALAT